MNSVLYLEINLFAMFILCLPLINVKKNLAMTLDDRLFRSLLLSVLLLLFVDTCGWMLEGRTFGGAHTLLFICDTVYYVQTTVICVMWMMYSDYRCFQNAARTKKLLRVLLVPGALLILLALSSPFTGLVFTIDAANLYIRGPLFAVHTIISWCVLPYSCVTALIQSKREQTNMRKSECRQLALFSLLPMIGGMIQILAPSMPLMWITSVGSLLMVFINLQNRQISLDGLTNINNRRTLDRFIGTRFSVLKPNEALFLLMIDIDDFKSINDTYGHAVGDTALITTSEILKKICSTGNYFLARFGGDEFAIVFVRGAGDSADDILERIAEETRKQNKTGSFPRPLSYSAGYASLRAGDPAGVDGLISAADRWMYKRKRGRKQVGAAGRIPFEKM